MSKNNQVLEVVSIDQIDVSKTNPRKSFDEKALNELTQSIKEHGILQPVLVRPVNSSLHEPWEQFELVCGERRYRAAKLAGLEEIPVNIRVLTDDEAFELQIIENLERKDVHPLDEADAFKKMLDSGKYTIADIAAKMAKPESFIVQRLKLVDLIDPVRSDFIAGHLGIGHAILIARCDEFQQLDIHKNAQPYNDNYSIDYGTIKELKETIEDDSYLLSDAKFDLSDDKLVNDTCACNVCPKRSGANPLLFEDMQDDRCFDKSCFEFKSDAFVEKEVAKIISEGKNIPILAAYSKPSDLVVTICKQYDIPILKNYDEWSSYHREDWNLVTGFVVSGGDTGKYLEVYLKPKNENETEAEAYSSTGSKAPISNEVRELKEEIAKIESRADRAKELDGEKVWTQIRAIDTSEIKTIIGGLFEVEVNAVCLAMISKLSWEAQKQLKEKVGDFKLETIQERDFTKFEYNQIQRIFFLDVLPSSFGNYYSNLSNYAYTKALMHYESDKINEIIANQKAISDVRMDKADAKIKDLKAKIEKIKPTEDIEVISETVEPEVEHEIGEGSAAITSTLDIPTFHKIVTKKRYSLNNSYFKNRLPSMPATPLEVMYYFNQHGELPFDMGSDTENWLYECYVEYQKRAGVYGSQFFTPPATAKRMAELAEEYFGKVSPHVLDMCCGFGMLTQAVKEKGFIVEGFDNNSEMLELYNQFTGCTSFKADINGYSFDGGRWNIISNPPYEIKECTQFLKLLWDLLVDDGGLAILLLPKGFIDKDKPKALVEVLEKFNVVHREDMDEEFARTKINAEIVVIEKL